MEDKRLLARCLQFTADEVKKGRVEMRQAVGRRDKEAARRFVMAMTEAFMVIHSLLEGTPVAEEER